MRPSVRYLWPAYLLFLIPIFTYGWFLNAFAINLPWADDSAFMLYIHHRSLPSDTWATFWADTFRQHIDHRIATPRLLIWLTTLLQGELNFRTTIILGNLSVLASVGLLYRSFRRSGHRFWLFVPVSFLIFQPVHYVDSLWTICVYQHNFLIFWVLLALECLQFSRAWAFILAILAALAATYSGGNGMFLWLPGLLVLLIQKKYRWAGLWAVIVGVGGILYFVGLQTSQETHIKESLSQPLEVIKCAAVFLGGMTSAFSLANAPAIGLGLVISLILVLSLLLVTRKTLSLSTLGLLLFLAMSAGAVALSRSWSGIAITDRYQIYAAFALTAAYLLVIDLLRPSLRNSMGVAAIFASILFWISAWYEKYPLLIKCRDSLLCESSNWQRNGRFLDVLLFHNQAFQYAYVPLITKQIYQFPAAISIPDSAASTVLKDTLALQYDPSFPGKLITVKSEQIDLNSGPVYLILKSANSQWLAPFLAKPNGKVQFLKTGKPLFQGGTAQFMTESLPRGMYQLGLVQQHKLYWLPQYFTKTD